MPVIPPVSAGWRYRRKNSFFENYNFLAKEFAHLIQTELIFNYKNRKICNFDSAKPSLS